MSGQAPDGASDEFKQKNCTIRAFAAEFLQTVLLKIPIPDIAARISFLVQDPVLQCLAGAVSGGSEHDPFLQATLLGVLRTILLLDSHAISNSQKVFLVSYLTCSLYLLIL